ncbi:outer membrane protein [Xanthobacter tagetidis]|uniref:Porin family protein n=1 Tax=Xanthobacter tagetidis TaxID=60216 RepID=A0A3L7AN22_9HYPH|nr:outer membrane protein [Xanthobacter tagetidis]MBB6308299.1 outer membrane immunogenic protein [Xanthobacter tagetidis]RLP81903.1 porin family protein [Xanthobacter tagetidis]
MKRVVLAGAMLSVVSAGPVLAADLGRAPAPVAKAPVVVPAPVFSWTGFYIGGNAGYGWGSGKDALDLANINPSGWSAGGQVGFNYQFANNIVAGIEADLQGGDISASTGGLSSSLDMLGTVRGRLGYAFGRVLPYVTGGLAYGNNSVDNFGWNQSQTHVGWTAGAGVEYALTDHWTAKAEYLYTDLGSKYYDNIGADAGVTAQTGKIGINYKF